MLRVQHVNELKGELEVPGDKSISHRSVMFGSLARGTTRISGFLPGADCLSTISCFRRMGVDIEQNGDEVTVRGKGWFGLKEPADVLDVGNSGTTIRLMMGILATQPFHSVLVGDESIARRPMRRVVDPLSDMGADIRGRAGNEYTPLSIKGGGLEGMEYATPVASAQVKSAVLLAGLQAEGSTTVKEPHRSRDHTERMLEAFGANVSRDGLSVTVRGGEELHGREVRVPGDISSAAYFIAAALIVSDGEITIKNVGVNPTRTGIIDVVQRMGGTLIVENERIWNGEPVADLHIRSSSLKGVEIGGDLIPRLIDEIPVIAVIATQAEGETVIRDAQELKVKETNRIDTVVSELKKFGAEITATEDGMRIKGKSRLSGAHCNTHGDHRIGMAMAIAGLIADGETKIEREDAINVSFPGFYERLKAVTV